MKEWIEMNLNNFLCSGFKFGADEDLLQFKFKMLNSIFIIIAFFSVLFGLLSDLDINDIGPIHSKVTHVYSFFTIMLILFLRSSKKNYKLIAHFLLIISLVTFTSKLLFVPQDEFRMIWFYLLVFVAYILLDKTNGLLYTAASIGIILTVHSFVELYLSQTAINTGVLGLIIGSFLLLVKITNYENSLNRKNSMECEGQNISVTTSVGITQNSETDSSFDDIFPRADTALYQAKNEGRNRTCYVSPLDESINYPRLTEQK